MNKGDDLPWLADLDGVILDSQATQDWCEDSPYGVPLGLADS